MTINSTMNGSNVLRGLQARAPSSNPRADIKAPYVEKVYLLDAFNERRVVIFLKQATAGCTLEVLSESANPQHNPDVNPDVWSHATTLPNSTVPRPRFESMGLAFVKEATEDLEKLLAPGNLIHLRLRNNAQVSPHVTLRVEAGEKEYDYFKFGSEKFYVFEPYGGRKYSHYNLIENVRFPKSQPPTVDQALIGFDPQKNGLVFQGNPCSVARGTKVKLGFGPNEFVGEAVANARGGFKMVVPWDKIDHQRSLYIEFVTPSGRVNTLERVGHAINPLQVDRDEDSFDG